ncbi:sugar transferase [Paenibacillus sp. FSL H8-0261]|uniref:sugar transferase n=1 Tax=Paenibacillus sp. FSL H8-0261 TaxID=2921381 RepID=UPI0032483E11
MSELSRKQHEISGYSNEQIQCEFNSVYNRYIKRVIGLIIALILIILLLPFLFLIAIAIIVDSGFPVFYKADRGGYRGKTFKIFKFRTMINNADKIGGGTTALNDNRITKVGKFLRRTKMDEIPQLLNIIKGEMSFIGPRPELLKYTSQYKGVEKCILEVRPGISDFSSIEFINLDEVVGSENADEAYEKYVLERKNSLRIKYVSQISLKIDCELFLLTINRTIKKALKTILQIGDTNGKNLTR